MLDLPMITCAIIDMARRAMAAKPRDRSRLCGSRDTNLAQSCQFLPQSGRERGASVGA
jgi:hypothetical protein